MKDKHGRSIDYLRISLTDRCNMRCVYCMPASGVVCMSHDQILRIEEIARLVRIVGDLGISRIRLTGGEPLVRKGVVELVSQIHDTPGIQSVALTTNGALLPKYASQLKNAGLSRVNISLDTLDAREFKAITRNGNLEEVLAGIDSALETGFNPVKINAVAVRSLNQDFLKFASLSIDRPLHVRFIEYMPLGDNSQESGTGWGMSDVIFTEELFQTINSQAVSAGLGELIAQGKGAIEGWGPARYYSFAGAKGTVGFISPVSRHFCGECNRMRLTADGKLRPCLFSDVEYDVREALRYGSDEDVRQVYYEALGAKPDDHHDKQGTVREMSQIGG